MDNAIQAAHEKQDYVTQDESVRQTYWRRQMAIMDRNGQLEYAHDEGLAEGLTQGIEQGIEQTSLEIAQKMKARGRSLLEIAEDTGLTLEVVQGL